jgi:peptidyl-prolyl cis-trans isomerase A (cyclophilin A)
LADATAGLEGTGPLIATIKTSHGEMRCKLLEDKAPITVANFVGLARGVRPYVSSTTRSWAKKPLYDGTTFHRVIKGFMIQGGDPEGTGMGQPGYVIPDEIWPGSTHDHAGQLCMANRGPNTNGAQFFITDAAVTRLDGKYTIFGDCTPASVVRSISSVPKDDNDRPNTTVRIDKIEISRGE